MASSMNVQPGRTMEQTYQRSSTEAAKTFFWTLWLVIHMNAWKIVLRIYRISKTINTTPQILRTLFSKMPQHLFQYSLPSTSMRRWLGPLYQNSTVLILLSPDQFNRHARSLRTTLTINFGQQNMHNISQKLHHRIQLEMNFRTVYLFVICSIFFYQN
jgi:hypothetical protein